MPAVSKRSPPRDPLTGARPVTRPTRLAAEPVSRRLKRRDRWEAGFLRLDAPAAVAPLSSIVDTTGVYFDATAPSELERLLEQSEGWETPQLLARAHAGMAALRRAGLSLDNDPRRRILPPPATGGRVIVVDQPHDDPTSGFALAGAAQFEAMLEAAVAEAAGAEVMVVMDPAVASPPQTGRLFRGARRAGVRYEEQPVSAWSVVAGADRLHAVAAHVGFEAAWSGVRVALHGAPFYAGWGFTDDRLLTPRRTRRRSAAEVFAAAYLVQSRYADPFTGEDSDFEDAVDILRLAVERARENLPRTLCVGFAGWKAAWVGRALASRAKAPEMTPAGREPSAEALARAERVVSWASREPAGAAQACAAAGKPLLRMEDGFLRSVGLGVGLRAGASYVLDARGMYYDATRPSDLEVLLETHDFDEALLARAARLRRAIVEAGLSKYNVGAPAPPLPPGRPVVLVAGQVADDASLRLGLSEVSGPAELLARARAAHPDALIAFKPHPDVEAGLRPGRLSGAELDGLCDVVLRDVSASAAIDASDRVEVATSLMGFEALLRGKPVRTHGLPFYAGWGLTQDPGSPRRTRLLTLDQLVAGALILYPRYFDPVTGLACSPEVLVGRLAQRHPALGARARTAEAVFKQAWSSASRAVRRG